MEIMGYNAYGIGDQELYYSLTGFLDKNKRWTGSIISASLRTAEGKPVFTPYKIFTLNDVRIGVTGLVAE